MNIASQPCLRAASTIAAASRSESVYSVSKATLASFARRAEAGMQDALARLRTPQFGVCESCGGDIAYVKLAGNPRLTRCPACS